MSTFLHALSTNNYGSEKFIVSASAAEGTHTTIAAALTAATSGDTIFIRPGTYTENLTLKAGVNIVANLVDGNTPNVTIVGTCTLTTAGTVSISGVRLQTNGSFALAITGSAASFVELYNCYLNFTNNTGISFTSSSASSGLLVWSCILDLTTTGIAYMTQSAAGHASFVFSSLGNSGASTTQTSASAGAMDFAHCTVQGALSYTGTSGANIEFCDIDMGSKNITALTLNIAGAINCDFCKFTTGTATPIVVTGGQLSLRNASLDSTNASNVSGAGSLNYSNITFANPNHAMTVTSRFAYNTTNGIVVQQVRSNSTSNFTTTTTIPQDNTIPQITEGAEFLTVTITPTNGSNVLILEANLSFDAITSPNQTIAFFVDATANALAAFPCVVDVGGQRPNYSPRFYLTAGSTTARTYRLRVGPAVAGTCVVNPALYGGVAFSSFIVSEINTT